MRRLFAPTPDAGRLGTAALAPLVDVVALLLIFLLRAWSSDPPLVLDEPLTLARSAGEEAPPARLAVDVTPRSIRVGGQRVVGTAFYAGSEEALVRELYAPMLQHEGGVALRVDGSVPYAVVRKVLFTLREAGVEDVSFVAESRAGL